MTVQARKQAQEAARRAGAVSQQVRELRKVVPLHAGDPLNRLAKDLHSSHGKMASDRSATVVAEGCSVKDFDEGSRGPAYVCLLVAIATALGTEPTAAELRAIVEKYSLRESLVDSARAKKLKCIHVGVKQDQPVFTFKAELAA